MISEILGLLKILQDQVRKKTERDRSFFSDFIAPIWELFNTIHEDYKASFNRYSSIISKDDHNVKSLVDEIGKDSAFTVDLRSNLKNMRSSIHPTSPQKAIKFSDFLSSIDRYFEYRGLLPFSMIHRSGQDWVFLSDTHSQVLADGPLSENQTRLWRELSEIQNHLEASALQEIFLLLDKSEALEFHSEDAMDRGKIYLEYCSHGLITERSYQNSSRKALIIALGISPDNSRERIGRILDYLLAGIQHRYHQVGRNYFRLKAEFLT